MTSTKLLAVLLAGLLVTAGAGTVAAVDATATAANEPTDTPTGDDPADDSETSLDLAVDASFDNGSVDLTVTDNGTGIENVSVATDAGHVGATDANGSLTFETNASEELELALTGDNWSAEYVYTIENGSLVLADSEVELEGEDADEGQKGPDENASETAHTVWGTIQEWLENNREGKLGQLIQEALGHGNGNGQADDHRPAHAGKNAGDDDGDAAGNDKKPDHAGKNAGDDDGDAAGNDKPGKQDDRSKSKQNGHAKGHDSQNAQTDDDNDETDDDSDDSDDSDE